MDTKTDTCAICHSTITLVKTGVDSWKWVTNPAKPKDTWRCGHDPEWPVRGHSPDPKTFAHTVKTVAAIAALLVLTSAAIAESPQQVIRDARGNTIGTATRDSQGTTTFRDSGGRTTGTASTDSQGTTTFRDQRGSVTSTTTTPFIGFPR
jgi:hypothetical protein